MILITRMQFNDHTYAPLRPVHGSTSSEFAHRKQFFTHERSSHGAHENDVAQRTQVGENACFLSLRCPVFHPLSPRPPAHDVVRLLASSLSRPST